MRAGADGDETTGSPPREELPRDDVNGLAIVSVGDLSHGQKEGMLALLRRCYDDVDAAQFERDLAEKEWAVVGTDPDSGGICMFSTLRTLRLAHGGRRISAIYSGDTASLPEKRGGPTSAGIRLLVRMMYQRVLQPGDEEYYWFMISSTYKSYRLLSLLFNDFAPCPERDLTDDERDIVSRLSAMKGFHFDPGTGLVHLPHPSLPAEEDTPRRSPAGNDPPRDYFATKNPGASRGDRLASLTRLTVGNLTSMGKRFVLADLAGHSR